MHKDCNYCIVDSAWLRDGWDVLVFEGLIEVAMFVCLPGVEKECTRISLWPGRFASSPSSRRDFMNYQWIVGLKMDCSAATLLDVYRMCILVSLKWNVVGNTGLLRILSTAQSSF